MVIIHSIIQFSLIVTLFIFFAGLFGIFVFRRNLINVLIAIELLFLSCSLFFVFFSLYLNDIVGQIFALFIVCVAAAESSIALALLTIKFRLVGQITVDYLNKLKG